jgi:glutamate dehydrogenase
VLLAYAKRDIADALLSPTPSHGPQLIDDPVFEDDLRGYFPQKVVERLGEHIPAHRLRRELAATIISNEVVNSLGPTFVSRLQTERGAAGDAVVRAYRIAVIATRARERWDAIEALDGTIEPDVYWTLMGGVDELVEGVARWQLANAGDGPIAELGQVGREGCDALLAILPTLRSEQWRAECEAIAADLAAHGAPEALARAHAMQQALVHAPDVIVVAQRTQRSVEDVAATSSRWATGCAWSGSRSRSTRCRSAGACSAGRRRHWLTTCWP